MIKTYQWVKGEDAGKVVKWDNVSFFDEALDMNFMVFQDGSRANATLLNDFFMEIPNENELILMPDPKPLPVQQNPPLQRVNLETAPAKPEIEKTISPMHRLLHESKKTKSTVSVAIVADMPPVELMKVLADSYDDGEKQVLAYISSTINVEDVKEQIAKQIWLSAFTASAKRTRKTGINETT